MSWSIDVPPPSVYQAACFEWADNVTEYLGLAETSHPTIVPNLRKIQSQWARPFLPATACRMGATTSQRVESTFAAIKQVASSKLLIDLLSAGVTIAVAWEDKLSKSALIEGEADKWYKKIQTALKIRVASYEVQGDRVTESDGRVATVTPLGCCSCQANLDSGFICSHRYVVALRAGLDLTGIVPVHWRATLLRERVGGPVGVQPQIGRHMNGVSSGVAATDQLVAQIATFLRVYPERAPMFSEVLDKAMGDGCTLHFRSVVISPAPHGRVKEQRIPSVGEVTNRPPPIEGFPMERSRCHRRWRNGGRWGLICWAIHPWFISGLKA
jgi:hypothetical protein